MTDLLGHLIGLYHKPVRKVWPVHFTDEVTGAWGGEVTWLRYSHLDQMWICVSPKPRCCQWHCLLAGIERLAEGALGDHWQSWAERQLGRWWWQEAGSWASRKWDSPGSIRLGWLASICSHWLPPGFSISSYLGKKAYSLGTNREGGPPMIWLLPLTKARDYVTP